MALSGVYLLCYLRATSSHNPSHVAQSYHTPFPCSAPHPLQVFIESSLPVIQHYEALGKVARINADRSADDIYKEVRRLVVEL
jgi:hypothetical protein